MNTNVCECLKSTWSGRDKLGAWDEHTYTLLCIRQITNKDLVYSTRNSTHYSVTAYLRKESEKEYIYMYN